jgi:hypothetical protein
MVQIGKSTLEITMTITQKTIWMRYLLLGVFSVSFFGFSCKKRVDYAQYAEFRYLNSTSKKIVMDYPKKKFAIEANGGEYYFEVKGIGPKTISPDSYNFSLPINLTEENRIPVTIKIGEKCFTSTERSEHTLINVNSYQIEKIDEGHYKFTYTFTEADYNLAVNCP